MSEACVDKEQRVGRGGGGGGGVGSLEVWVAGRDKEMDVVRCPGETGAVVVVVAVVVVTMVMMMEMGPEEPGVTRG